MPPYLTWKNLLWVFALALLFILTVRSDLSHLRWAENLSQEGSPAPQLDADSPTGYALGQRHFLGTRDRGETYRWIAYTQTLIANGPFHSSAYNEDTVPEGRPQLMPKPFAAWLAAIAFCLHLVTGTPVALAVETAALWEPLISHVLAFFAVSAFAWRRYGGAAAVAIAAFFALFPLFSAQFIPGALTPLAWSLLLASYSLAQALPNREGHVGPILSLRAALAASLSLWLNPSVGFHAILIATALAIAAISFGFAKPACLKWSLAGAGFTLAAWLIDQNPLSTEAGELRYVHPLYASAWLGIGLALHGLQLLRQTEPPRTRAFAQLAIAAPLVLALPLTQASNGYSGWLHGGAATHRLTSLDETLLFPNAFAWIRHANLGEALLLLGPSIAALLVTALLALKHCSHRLPQISRSELIVAFLAFAAALAVAWFKVRWGIVASLLAAPLLWILASRGSLHTQRAALAVFSAYLIGLFAWGKKLPDSLQRPNADEGSIAADVESLVNRHFAHWLASHYPDQPLAVLAPPELSDSIIYHGGKSALMSTAWESHPGHVAASRFLSAPEASEAGAVLETRGITHVALTSWDPVLPLLVQEPQAENKNTLHERLQRWILPLFQRPTPYHLPPTPGYESEKLAVFETTQAQDEALALSRLAEYFVEMGRSEPARLAGKALELSFPQDPNAAIARAFVYADAKDAPAFALQLSRLASNVGSGITPYDWDRRVLRTIILALGKRNKEAKEELHACLESMTADSLYSLTPLQTFQLKRLVDLYGYTFPSEDLLALANARCSEYRP